MMTQAEYLSRLEYLLQSLPEDKKWEFLDDIRRHFDEGIADGLSEDAIAEGLGAPELLAREYTEPSQVQPPPGATPEAPRRQPRQGRGVFGALLWGTALFFLDLCVALPVFITLYALWFSLLATSAAMSVAGVGSSLLVLVNRILPLSFLYVSHPLFTFIAGITVTAIGLLLFMAVGPVWRGLGGMTRGFLRWNGRMLRGGQSYETR